MVFCYDTGETYSDSLFVILRSSLVNDSEETHYLTPSNDVLFIRRSVARCVVQINTESRHSSLATLCEMCRLHDSCGVKLFETRDSLRWSRLQQIKLCCVPCVISHRLVITLQVALPYSCKHDRKLDLVDFSFIYFIFKFSNLRCPQIFTKIFTALTPYKILYLIYKVQYINKNKLLNLSTGWTLNKRPHPWLCWYFRNACIFKQ